MFPRDGLNWKSGPKLLKPENVDNFVNTQEPLWNFGETLICGQNDCGLPYDNLFPHEFDVILAKL